ncbi:MAG: DNA primase [Flavobacteriales bacterium]
MALKRIIKDYKTLGKEHIDLINEHYPNGFENDNLVSFTTPKGQFIKALEIKTDDTIYLFKIDKNMEVDEEENNDNDGLSMGEFDNFKGDDSGDSSSDDDDDDDDSDNDNADEDDGDDD